MTAITSNQQGRPWTSTKLSRSKKRLKLKRIYKMNQALKKVIMKSRMRGTLILTVP